MGGMVQTARGLAVAVMMAALAGCSSGPTEEPRQSNTPTMSAPPTTEPPKPDESGPLRQRLVAGLSTDPPHARLVETAKLTVVPATWLPGWQIVDVVNSTLAHPQRFYLGLSADGTVSWLTANTEHFNQMVKAADLRIDSAKVPAEVAVTFLETNRTFRKASYRIERVQDIEWLPELTDEQTRARRQVETAYGSRITKPQARRSGTGWRVTVWMVYDHQLIRHDIEVAANGVVTDHPQRVHDGLPTPDSI